MRTAGRIVAETIEKTVAAVRPGITTAELDAVSERTILERGATPSFKGYRGFPASLCVSVNELSDRAMTEPLASINSTTASSDEGVLSISNQTGVPAVALKL